MKPLRLPSVRAVVVTIVVALCCYLIADWRGALVGAFARAVLSEERIGRLVVGMTAVALLMSASVLSISEAPVEPSISFTAERPNAATAARLSAVLVVAGLVVEVGRVQAERSINLEESAGP